MSAAAAGAAVRRDPGAESTIRREAGAGGCSAVGAAVVDRQDLHVFMAMPALELVFDAQVGKVHVLVEVRQVVLQCPLLDLSSVAIRVAVVIITVAIALVEPLLVFTLELVVEDDPLDAGIPFRQAFHLALVRAVDLGVVFELALAFEARVERLLRLVRAFPVRLQQVAARSVRTTATSRRPSR